MANARCQPRGLRKVTMVFLVVEAGIAGFWKGLFRVGPLAHARAQTSLLDGSCMDARRVLCASKVLKSG